MKAFFADSYLLHGCASQSEETQVYHHMSLKAVLLTLYYFTDATISSDATIIFVLTNIVD